MVSAVVAASREETTKFIPVWQMEKNSCTLNQKVRLESVIDFKGWNSQPDKTFPLNLESTVLSLRILSLRIDRKHGNCEHNRPGALSRFAGRRSCFLTKTHARLVFPLPLFLCFSFSLFLFFSFSLVLFFSFSLFSVSLSLCLSVSLSLCLSVSLSLCLFVSLVSLVSLSLCLSSLSSLSVSLSL